MRDRLLHIEAEVKDVSDRKLQTQRLKFYTWTLLETGRKFHTEKDSKSESDTSATAETVIEASNRGRDCKVAAWCQ